MLRISLKKPMITNRFSSFLLLFLALGLFLSACKTTKPSSILMTLSKDTSIKSFMPPDSETVISSKDILSIQVSSLNKELDEQFRASSVSMMEIDRQIENGFVVDAEGNIHIHYLGKIKVAGMKPSELEKKIENDLQPYMKGPIASVRVMNKKITVMGEVNSPRIINMGRSPISLLDALAGSGDLKQNADKSNIMILRDSASMKLVKHINLENHSFIETSWFYMQPNDVVYVTSKSATTDKEERKRNFQSTLSLVATGMTLLVIILNRF